MKRIKPSIIDQNQLQKHTKRQNVTDFGESLDSATDSMAAEIIDFTVREGLTPISSYVLYIIQTASGENKWTVLKRYNDFVTLYDEIKTILLTDDPQSANGLPPLPPKKFFGNFSPGFLEERKFGLQQWLKKVLLFRLRRVKRLLLVFLSSDAGEDLVNQLENVALSSVSSQETSVEGKVNDQVDVLDDFKPLLVLGKGSFGKVVLCRHKKTSKLYADKIIKKKEVSKGKQLQHTRTERRVLGFIDHPFLVKLHYAFQTQNKLHFILDYVSGGELFFHLGRLGRFSENLARFYAAEIVLALGYLHSKNIIYRDLKPENILLQADGHIKLADFGLSKEYIDEEKKSFEQISFSFCGTPEYLAPEVINKTGHNRAVDWWSLGSVLYEMLTGLPPWFSEDRRQLFRNIRLKPLIFPRGLTEHAEGVLKGLLDKNTALRLGTKNDAKEIKEHPFFQEMDFEKLLKKEIRPPYKPTVKESSQSECEPDTNNFDTCFTKMSLESRASDSNCHTRESLFQGFTFRPPVVPRIGKTDVGEPEFLEGEEKDIEIDS